MGLMSGDGTGRPGQEPDVVVFGQIARGLDLVVDEVPGPARSARVCERREMLGGKGANRAVGLAQLGMRPVLAGVDGAGNLVAWPGDCVFLPLTDTPVVDTTEPVTRSPPP